MQPDILTAPDRNLIGNRIRTKLAENRTFELWSGFKPREKEITGRVDSDFYSVQDFGNADNLRQFTPDTYFEKWAAVEVEPGAPVPEGMEAYTLPGGLYAVFIHKGKPETFSKTTAYIFGVWLPQSTYVLDDRPHFEVMHATYDPTSPESEEEVWVPIKPKV
ncbi:GyrI-like domain-containing protein [Pontibacter sp. MBLB2868]|uniref:GyrI-like domain-containing protein n=1 Tax=Pontibacter sp. MBLB2868 TaxID=3451555 RepID=UPI003F74F0BF